MTGRAAPSELELRANIHKRLYIPSSGPGSRNSKSKRFNRLGTGFKSGSVGPADLLANGFRVKGQGHGQGYAPGMSSGACLADPLIQQG